MVIASHGVFAARGFWVPNDPRGSWSCHVWAEHLKPFGESKLVNTSRSLAKTPHDRNHVRAIKAAMKYPPMRFNPDQRAAISNAFRHVVSLLHIKLYACAILQDHVHFVSVRHDHDVETLIGYFKRAATRELRERRLMPMGQENVTPWVRGGWKRFIDRREDIPQAIDYVNGNFPRSGCAVEVYPFVVPFRK